MWMCTGTLTIARVLADLPAQVRPGAADGGGQAWAEQSLPDFPSG